MCLDHIYDKSVTDQFLLKKSDTNLIRGWKVFMVNTSCPSTLYGCYKVTYKYCKNENNAGSNLEEVYVENHQYIDKYRGQTYLPGFHIYHYKKDAKRLRNIHNYGDDHVIVPVYYYKKDVICMGEQFNFAQIKGEVIVVHKITIKPGDYKKGVLGEF